MNFNRIAPFYSLGVRIFFGKNFYSSQASILFNEIEKHSSGNALIVGSGTGQLFNKWHKWPKNFNPCFIDKSKNMMQILKKQPFYSKSVWPTQEIDFFDFSTSKKFDLIIFPFFLDNFSDEKIITSLNKAKQILTPTGNILVIDFNAENTSKCFLLKLQVIHYFFKLFSRTQRVKLPNFNHLFILSKLDITTQKFFFKTQLFFTALKNRQL